MAQAIETQCSQRPAPSPQGLGGFAADWSADQEVFRHVHWGKAMMWIFLLSDTFIFSCFLTSYMTMRASTTLPWPNPSKVFALTIGGQSDPADPDRHHDLRADQQQRHDGDGGQFRLPPQPPRHRRADGRDRAARRELRGDAGLRMDTS